MLSSLNLTLNAFFCSNPVKLLKAALHGLQQQWNCERDVTKHRGIANLESWQQE
jgi:hypothetical protein